MINGIGVFKWNEGKKFFGFYKNDKKNGFGIYNWENPKKIFVGFWINGKQNGIGKFMEKNKVIFGFLLSSSAGSNRQVNFLRTGIPKTQ